MKVIFFKGKVTGDWIDSLISWWTRGPYAHCEIMFGDDPSEQVQTGSAQRGNGVYLMERKLDPEDWDIMDIPFGSEEVALQWFKSHLGLNYDYLGLLGLLSPVGNEYNHWFCSEACAAALGIPEPWRLDPNRLALMLRMMGGTWNTEFSTIASKV